MKNDWQTNPIFPFLIDNFVYKKKILSKDFCYHILYLNQGRVFYKKPAGFIIFNEIGFLIIPPLLGPGIRFDTESRGYEITMNRLLFDELTAKVIDKGLLYFPENEVSFFSLKDQEEDIFNRIIENLIREWKNKKSGFRDIIRLKLVELFINLSRIENVSSAYTNPGESDSKAMVYNKSADIDIHTKSKKITDILSYLEAMYYQPLSLDNLADETGFSTSYLSRYFKNKTGMCLFEYINKLRIRRACFLLKNTNKKIIEIAYDVGYNNISFFNRYFKKTLKISPMEYRKRVRL